jgi:tRNA(Ile)-lysidine synthase
MKEPTLPDAKSRTRFRANRAPETYILINAAQRLRARGSSCTILSMRDLPERLLATIRKHELLRPGDRVAAAVSGGADSVALLLLLDELRAELGIVLSIAHVNHKLRGAESDADEAFTAGLAARLGLEFDVAIAPIEAGASSVSVENTGGGKPNLEASARKRRYEFFRSLGERGRANKLVTAHTLDDQAETVLLRLFRGTGIRGLAGIHPRLPANGGTGALTRAGNNFAAEIIRPLLTFRRADLRAYLRARGENWREDSSNADVTFLRNRVRQRVLPLITEEFGDAALEHMADLAEIARAEEKYWTARARDNAESAETGATSSAGALDTRPLLESPLAVQRRQVLAWLEANAPEASLSFSLVEEILALARGPAGKKLELPGRVDPQNVRRGRSQLTLEFAADTDAGDADRGDYEYLLPVPGAVIVTESGARIEARIVDAGNHLDSEAEPVSDGDSVSDEDRNGLLDPAHIGESLAIRNWRPGDRYWPAHTAKEKKVKDLLADVHATGRKKKLWPVAVNPEGKLVWMRGFAAPESFRPRGRKAVRLREIAKS